MYFLLIIYFKQQQIVSGLEQARFVMADATLSVNLSVKYRKLEMVQLVRLEWRLSAALQAFKTTADF